MKAATRKVVTRSPGRTVRMVNLPHLQSEPIQTESDPERNFVHIAALFHRTRSIRHQPFKLELSTGNYTPDFLLTFLDESQYVVEVKAEFFVDQQLRVLAEAESFLKTHKLPYLLATDARIYEDGLADRALRIRRYGKGRVDVFKRARVINQLEEHTKLALAELLAVGADLVTISYMVARREVEISADLRLEPDSELRLAHQHISGEADAIRFGKWFANSQG